METDYKQERHHHDEELAAQHEAHTSVRAQLATWHADRGDKSIAACIVPTWRKQDDPDNRPIYNPFTLMRMLSPMDWAYFFSGWLAWTCDGFDYFAVSVTLPELTKQFNHSAHDLTTAMTLTLLFRSLGALVFGALADRFGRKYTLVFNLLIIAVLEMGTGFTNTFTEFLGVRAIFGIAMGGIWGQAAATALENVPVQARGLLSGIMQQGYACGYLLAAVFNLTVGQYSRPKWRSVFFIGAGLSVGAAIVRLILPESRQYLEARKRLQEEGVTSKEASRRFLHEVVNMLKTNWVRAIWAIFVMTGFNFLSHGSQDLYPTYLQKTKGLSTSQASRVTIISNCGAIVGGTLAGYISQYAGRRLCALIFLAITAAFIPLWILPKSFGGLSAGGFWMQFGVQGAWGIVPVYLSEVSPPAFRASFAGLAYQLGNMASSGAAQIEATGGENITITKPNGTVIPDYATVQGILMGCVIGWTTIWLFLGPEADGSHFEQAKAAYQTGAGNMETRDLNRHMSHTPDDHPRHDAGAKPVDYQFEKTPGNDTYPSQERSVV